MTGVTSETWAELGSAFIKARGGTGFVIALAEGVLDKDTELEATPREWAAWWAYFSRKKCGPRTFMKSRAQATTYDGRNKAMMTVPARWPHEFDAEATLADDMAAANHFMQRFKPPVFERADAAQRAITAAWARKMVGAQDRRGVTEPPPPPAEPMPIPTESDLTPQMRAMMKRED